MSCFVSFEMLRFLIKMRKNYKIWQACNRSAVGAWQLVPASALNML